MWIILSSELGSQVAWRVEVVGWEMIDEVLVVSSGPSVLMLGAAMVTYMEARSTQRGPCLGQHPGHPGWEGVPTQGSLPWQLEEASPWELRWSLASCRVSKGPLVVAAEWWGCKNPGGHLVSPAHLK